MNESMYAEKQHFAQNELTTLLKACDCGVVSADYYVKDGAELVTVRYGANRSKKINVTGDGLIALVYDVIRGII